ncbi:MAG: endolytic transglycosylase MltG [Clostridiales bacterium]|nr:endolytic transglycosylase MltG [Clostridiales bacterium]MDD6873193.1 endolytic transglycosylase MltG [Clostridiales bacterium]MDY2872588.1 endolytic transglycosylase MltG [Eubacteriales bacterium]
MARKKRRVVSRKFYNQRTLLREREYGFYWYAWLWKIIRPILIFGASAIIVLGIFINVWFALYDNFLKPVNPDDQTTVTFKINQGDYVSTIGNHLVEQGLLRNKGIFKYMVMFKGVTSDIQYGTYQLSPSMNVSEIIDILSSGTSSVERSITIIPGWTVEDIANYFYTIGAIENKAEFLALCNDQEKFASVSHQVAQAVEAGSTSGRKYLLEGYLAPDTYRVFTTASAESLIKTLLSQTELVMDDLYASIEANEAVAEGSFVSTLTQDQTIILASMIEKEAGTADDYGRVSAVFHNRLARGMRLESDPTVKYVTGSTDFILPSDELNLDSAYNTYVIGGLPVGPICNPSKAAIEAALHPNQDYINEGYLYFCSKDPSSGELQFSRTLEEHEAAVAQYRPLWEAYDAEQRAKAAETPQPTEGTNP